MYCYCKQEANHLKKTSKEQLVKRRDRHHVLLSVNIHNYSCYKVGYGIANAAQSQFILKLSSLHQVNGCPQPLATVHMN